MLDLGTAVGYLMLDTSGFTGGFKNAQSYMRTFMDSTVSAQDRMKAFENATNSVGSTLTKSVTLPLIGAGTASLMMASDLQSAMNKVKQNVGDTTTSMEEFEDVLRSVYKAGYGEDYNDIAEAISQINQQMGDMPKEQLEETAEAAFLLRDAFGYETEESIRAANTLMTQFGISGKAAFDLIAYGAQNGLDYSGELIDSINEYSVHFAQAGFDAQAMFNIFTSGVEAGAFNLDKIGDAVKEFGIRIKEGSDEAGAALEGLGFNAQYVEEQFALGGDAAASTFDSIIRALGDMEDPLEQNRYGVYLFGTMWEDLGAKVITNLDSIGDAAEGANGAIDEMKQQRMDDLKVQLETLKRSIGDLGTEFGLILLPYVQGLVEGIQDAVEWFANLDDGTKNIITGILTFVAVLGPALLLISQLAGMLTAINAGLTVLGVTSKVALPAILLIVAALAALVAIIVAVNSAKSGKQVDTNDPSFNPNPKSIPTGSYASGLDYVPTDRTVKVHEGEGILTKEENKEYRSTNSKKNDKPMFFTFVAELDGAVVARKQYKYDSRESSYRGPHLVR